MPEAGRLDEVWAGQGVGVQPNVGREGGEGQTAIPGHGKRIGCVRNRRPGTSSVSWRCTQTTTGVWHDSDIVVLTREISGTVKAFALLNCKTSDHSRNDTVLFWALALRDNNIKYCLVTQDLDNKFGRGDGDPLISGFQKRSGAFLDRVYSTNPATIECSQVRRRDFMTPCGTDTLLEDLHRWRKDVVPGYSTKALEESAL